MRKQPSFRCRSLGRCCGQKSLRYLCRELGMLLILPDIIQLGDHLARVSALPFIPTIADCGDVESERWVKYML